MDKTKKLKSVLETKARFNCKKKMEHKKKIDGYQPGEPGFDPKMMV